jgi:hypothetical protein
VFAELFAALKSKLKGAVTNLEQSEQVLNLSWLVALSKTKTSKLLDLDSPALSPKINQQITQTNEVQQPHPTGWRCPSNQSTKQRTTFPTPVARTSGASADCCSLVSRAYVLADWLLLAGHSFVWSALEPLGSAVRVTRGQEIARHQSYLFGDLSSKEVRLGSWSFSWMTTTRHLRRRHSRPLRQLPQL